MEKDLLHYVFADKDISGLKIVYTYNGTKHLWLGRAVLGAE